MCRRRKCHRRAPIIRRKSERRLGAEIALALAPCAHRVHGWEPLAAVAARQQAFGTDSHFINEPGQTEKNSIIFGICN